MNRWFRRYYPLMIATLSLSFVYLYSKVNLEETYSPVDLNQSTVAIVHRSNLSSVSTVNEQQHHQRTLNNVANPYRPSKMFQRTVYQVNDSEWMRSTYSNLLDMESFTFIKNGSTVCSNLPATPFPPTLPSFTSDNNHLNRINENPHNQSTILSSSPVPPVVHPSNEINLLAFVHSAPMNFDKRRIIRSTWASRHIQRLLGMRVIFLLGETNSTQLQASLDDESTQFGDLVQGNFADTYANLTYKHLMGYKWVLTFCRGAKFIMKIDDDAYVDIFRVISFLRSTFHPVFPNGSPQGILSCSLFPAGVSVKRKGKWRLTETEYPYDTLPAYCSGIGYFVTPDVVQDLYAISPFVKPALWIDDLFITGILAAHLPLHHQPINFKFTYDPSDLRRWLKSTSDRRPSPYLIGDIGDISDWKPFMIKLWAKTSQYFIV